MTKEIIEPILDRLKINKVVWVDDIFEMVSQLLDEDIIKYISGNQNCLEACAKAEFSVDFIDLVRELQGMAGTSSLLLQKLENESDKAKMAFSEIILLNGTASDNDFSSQQVEAISKIFGDRLKKCSFTDWPRRIDELTADKNTIFFVDLKNKNGIGGKDVLSQLIARRFQGLITLFTHECTMDGEVELLEIIRVELQTAKEDSLSALRIGVISKQRCQPEMLESREHGLAAPIYRLAMTTTFSYLASAVATSLREGIENGVKLLAMLPITDIDRVVFQNSMREGCSEIELVERLLFLMQREAVTRSLKSQGDLNELLSKARDSWITGVQKQSLTNISPELTKLRALEVFDSGELVNLTYSPLSNGDIFEVGEGAQKKQYVLLMSPCDSMVRDDGTRQLDTGFFVLVNESDKNKIAEPNQPGGNTVASESVVLLPASGNEEAASGATKDNLLVSAVDSSTTLSKVEPLAKEEEPDADDAQGDTRLRFYALPVNLEKDYRLDFVNSCPVVLDSLEWCVFNADGIVRYNKNLVPGLALLKGWERRLSKLKSDGKLNKCQNPDQVPWPYRHLALKSKGFSAIHTVIIEKENAVAKKGFLFFNLKRVKRLRSPYADAALSAYLSYTGRPAFEHEFIR